MGSWTDIDTAIAQATAEFDPSRLSVADAVALLPLLTRAKNALAAAEALTAARIAESARWQSSGARSPAEDYARRTGMPIGAARDALAAAEAMSESERLRVAALAGRLSPAQAGVIGDVAGDVPDAVDELLDLLDAPDAGPGQAGGPSLQDLKAAADTARASADPDPEATHRRIHAEREMRQWTRRQRGHLAGSGTVSDSAWLAAQLEPIIDELRAEARSRGEVPSEPALRYDAFMLLIARGAGVERPPAPGPSPNARPGDPDEPLPGGPPHGRPRGGAPTRPVAPTGPDCRPSPRPARPEHTPAVAPGELDLFPTSEPTTASDHLAAADADLGPEPVVRLWAGGGSAGDGADARPWLVDPAPAADAAWAATSDSDGPWVATGWFAGAVLLDPVSSPPASPQDLPVPGAARRDTPAVPGGPAPPGAAGPLTAVAPADRGGRRGTGKAWSKATVIIRVDASAAQRGRAVTGELCEMAGVGPVPLSVVQTALDEGAKLAIVSTRTDGPVETVAHVRRDRTRTVDITDPTALQAELSRSGVPVADLVHAGRRPTVHQVTALKWTSPTCTAEGCSNLSCEVDHETGYALTRTTRLGDLDPLCKRMHWLKTHRGWALVSGAGTRPFVPPDDPRHPKNAP